MGKYEDIIKKNSDGITINLIVTPDDKKSVFPAGYDEWRKAVKIKVCSPAKDNQANIEVIKTVAKFFDKPVQDVFIISGGKNKEKTVLVKDASVGYIVNKLEASLNGL